MFAEVEKKSMVLLVKLSPRSHRLAKKSGEWKACDEEIAQVDEEIVKRASHSALGDILSATQILMTALGVSHYSGLTLASRIGPIERFPRPRSLRTHVKHTQAAIEKGQKCTVRHVPSGRPG